MTSGGSGDLPGGGTYVTLVPPVGSPPGLTVIIETFVASSRCMGVKPTAPQALVFALSGGAPLPPSGTVLSVWQTTETALFVQLPDITIAEDGTFAITAEVDAIVTLSTTRGARKGVPTNNVPPSAPFPLPYGDAFDRERYPTDDVLARYWSDQYGSFAVRGGQLLQVQPMHNGVNAWVAPYTDPLTIIGDPLWTDVSIAVSVAMPATSFSSHDGSPALLSPCSADSLYQQWLFNVSGREYVSNAGSPRGECLNVYGCKDTVVLWQCVTSGGTCCGPDCYQGLQWRLDATSGNLRTALPDAACVTASAASEKASLVMAPCASPATALQVWRYNAATGLLQLGDTGMCLAQAAPPPPPPPYAQVCGRVGPVNGFSDSSVPGICLRLAAEGVWNVTAGAASLAGGRLSPVPSAGELVALNLTLVGTSVTARIAGLTVATVATDTHKAGFAALGSSVNEQAFDNFAVAPASQTLQHPQTRGIVSESE